jgi:hypothetical protein
MKGKAPLAIVGSPVRFGKYQHGKTCLKWANSAQRSEIPCSVIWGDANLLILLEAAFFCEKFPVIPCNSLYPAL